MAIYATRRQWSVTEYDRLVEVGILSEIDRVELLDGVIFQSLSVARRSSHTLCLRFICRSIRCLAE